MKESLDYLTQFHQDSQGDEVLECGYGLWAHNNNNSNDGTIVIVRVRVWQKLIKMKTIMKKIVILVMMYGTSYKFGITIP